MCLAHHALRLFLYKPGQQAKTARASERPASTASYALLFFSLCLLVSTPSMLLSQELFREKDEGLLSKTNFHGYANQGFGFTDGRKYRGVTESGTLDLRTAALQVRFAATSKDEVVLQLSHEKVGTSPSNELRDEAQFEWLFYRRSFNNGLELKVGRVPLPIGIYSEVKDAGVVIPFFRRSSNYYGEGTWASDTVDGAVLSYTFAKNSPWSVDAEIFGGSWERIESDSTTLSFDVADVDDSYGGFLWLNTPVSGLRFGFGYNRYDVSGGLFLPPGVVDTETTRYFSIDADFDRFTARFETYDNEFTGGYWRPYYLEFIYRLNERWQLMAVRDVGILKIEIPGFATFEDELDELWGAGVAFRFKPNVIFKAEHQWARGFGQIEDRPINYFFEDPARLNLVILSASVAF